MKIRWQEHCFSIGLTLIMVVTALMGDLGREWFQYSLDEIRSGEVWRIVTGHIVHLNLQHTILNVAGLWIIAYMFERNAKWWSWAGLTLVMSIGCSLLFMLLHSEPGQVGYLRYLKWYVGLSGSLHGLFFLAAISEWPVDKRLSIVLTAILVGKLIYAHCFGASPGTEEFIKGKVFENAHQYGAIQGIILGIAFRKWLFLTWNNPPEKVPEAGRESKSEEAI